MSIIVPVPYGNMKHDMVCHWGVYKNEKEKEKDLHTSRLALSARENQEAFQIHALVFVYAEDRYLDIVIPAWHLAKNFLFVIYRAFVQGCSLELKGRLVSRSKLTYHTCGFWILLPL